MPVRARSTAMVESRHTSKRSGMLLGFWMRIERAWFADSALLIALALAPIAFPSLAAAAPAPNIATLLAAYQRAANDPGAADIVSLESSGTLVGGGLSGSFHTWKDGDRERTDENLGPRTDTILRIGDRFWQQDANGDARELTGVLARRARTQDFIDSGAFAQAPERSAYRGRVLIDRVNTYALDVTAPDGETETLYLSDRTSLPVRLAYDDDDGRTTIDFSDYRDIGGHQFAFRSVISDGDHAFDSVQTTTQIVVGHPIAETTFVPLVPRVIAMSGTDTVSLDVYEGHLYAPVMIGGHRYTFLLDTGAQDIVVDRHVALELGLTPIGALEASGATRTGGLQLVKLDSIQIGKGSLTGIIASTLDLGASTSGVFRIDGILGYPFFAAATVRLDYSAKTITFGAPGSMVPQGEKIPVQVDRSFPEARLRLDARTDAPFIIDTGNAGEVLLYKPFLDAHPGLVPFSSTNRHSFGIGG